MNVLVTGGCGYIGSHMIRVLERAWHNITVIDRRATPEMIASMENCWDYDADDQIGIRYLLRTYEIDAVLHFSGRIQVAESVTKPRLYYRDNVAVGISLLDACLDAGVKKFIFSSSAAVYGYPQLSATVPWITRLPINEQYPCYAASPYGETKLIFENILQRYSSAYDFRSVSLRYFNAAGAADGLRERHEPETHLIPCAIDAALADKPVTIYGTDYPTPDGTAVRDYIHVSDLTNGHLKALDYLENGGVTDVINLGSGKGISVREVIAAVARATDRPGLTVTHAPRRPGDPPALVASIEKAARVLGWRPELSSIDRIVQDAVASRR